MRLSFRCPAELESILPPPLPTRLQRPLWYMRMPVKAYAEHWESDVETVKGDKGFTGTFDEGFTLRLACSIHVDRPGELRWDWVPPMMGLMGISRSPVYMLDPSFVAGTPYHHRDKAILGFSSFWSMDLPEGWSLLLCHLLNRPDMPFRVLSRVVRSQVGAPMELLETYGLWVDDHFTGVLPRGMPFAQAFLIPDGVLSIDTGVLSVDEVQEMNRYLRVTREVSQVMRPVKRRHHRGGRKGEDAAGNRDNG